MKIIFFIDGYPYYLIDKIKKSGLFNHYSKMKPSFGYSVNLHYELFQGKKADDLGFFGDAVLSDNLNVNNNLFFNSIDFFRFQIPFISRIGYKVYEKLTKKRLAFLPIKNLNNFDFIGKYLLQTYENISIGNDNYQIICYDNKIKFGRRDEAVYLEGLNLIKTKQNDLLLAFTELDWISHKYGVESVEFNKRVEVLIEYMKRIMNVALQKNKDTKFILLSDHGMINTKQGINLNLEKQFGFSGADGVFYFYDSLYLQLWNINNKKKLNQIIDYINNFDIAYQITSEERKKYGINSRKFGDVIFVLKEGLAFAPNYFGYGLLKAYHGYHPNTENNKGILCSNIMLSKNEYNSIEVFNFLKEKF